jgi:hypothetical protein
MTTKPASIRMIKNNIIIWVSFSDTKKMLVDGWMRMPNAVPVKKSVK